MGTEQEVTGTTRSTAAGEGRPGVSAESMLAALRLVSQGRLFDLDAGRFPGMPRHPAHPPFDVVTYRSPRGLRNGAEPGIAPPDNAEGFGFVLEMVTTSMHMGAHVDALCHVTTGPDDHFYGGCGAADHIGDKGALAYDATTIPPIVARGVLLDVPRALGVAQLPPATPVGPDELAAAAERQSVVRRPGDVVLVRTGHMADWPDLRPGGDPGITVEAAEWLSAGRPLAVGADNAAVEVLPSVVPGRPQPVHVHLIIEQGVYLLEWLWLEELAAAEVAEFLLLALPLKIRGATGSLLRPVAMC